MSETGRFHAWQAPEFGEPPLPREATPSLPTAEQIETIQAQAYSEGFELGRRDGEAAGRAELAEQQQCLATLLGVLARPFEELDVQVEQELVALALAVARHLVRRELRTDPGQIIAVVREALGALPSAEREVRVLLHPEDAALVRASLGETGEESYWRILEDPVLSRGGCRVEAGASHVDARLESRLNAVVAAVWGGEREEDRQQ